MVDRLKELIKFKGFQVAPAELEGCCSATRRSPTPPWSDCPTRRRARCPSGTSCSSPDRSASGEDILAFVAGEVASFKQLRQVVFIDAVPKSASGKILRRVLKEQAAAIS